MKKHSLSLSSAVLTLVLTTSCAGPQISGFTGEAPGPARALKNTPVYSEPNRSSKIISTVREGSRLDVVSNTKIRASLFGVSGYWLTVKTMNGLKGYVFGAGIEPALPQENPDDTFRQFFPDCPGSAENSSECASIMEKKLIAENPKLFIRSKDTLELRLSRGKKAVYRDNKVNSEAYAASFLSGYYQDLKLALVLLQGYESLNFELVHMETGRKIRLSGRPVFSPDSSRFTAVSMDLEAGYIDNRIEIVRVASGSFINELSKDLSWGPSSAQWTSDKELRLKRWDRTSNGFLKFSSFAVIEDNGWVLYE